MLIAGPDDIRQELASSGFRQESVGDPFTRCPVDFQLERIALFEIDPELLQLFRVEVSVQNSLALRLGAG